MQYTASVSKGDAAPGHNRREYVPDNADKTRVADNVVILDDDLEQVYNRLFGEALEEYNAIQVAKGRPGRQIANYLEHVKADKQLQEVHELVVALGDEDDHPDKELAEAVYRAWLATFQQRYSRNFVVTQAIIHNDEKVPHMHVEFVPVAESKRGLSRQNSLNKALKEAGHETIIDMYAEMQLSLEQAMHEHGIERVEGDKSKQLGGASMAAYKRIKAAEAKAEELEEQVLAKEGHRRVESVIDKPLKSPAEVARFAREAREAEKRCGTLREREKALRSEISDLTAQIQAAECHERELRAEVGRLHDACGRAGRVIDRVLAAAGELRLRASAAWRDSTLGRAVIDILNSRRCRYELGTVSGYVPGGLELRAVDGQLQRLREASRQQRGERQHDIQRGRSTTQTR